MAVSEFVSHLTPWALWDYYVTYLWNYESSSWVAGTASTFRVLSLIIFLPLASLAVMDIASYVIARTLGIVDDTRASTSDATTMSQTMIPTIQINAPTPEIEQRDEGTVGERLLRQQAGTESIDTSDPHAYFTTEESTLKLSGDDVFSPAPSTPPSPTLSRQLFREDTGSSTSFSVSRTNSEVTDSDDVIHVSIRRR